MTKLKNPLFSLGARGGLAKILAFAKRRGIQLVEKKPIVPDAKSLAQLSWRHMYQKAVALWHALSAAEKQDWESLARSRHMTGFAWFMSQALKPNPGLYLPLQGGTMSGDIDMDKNRILKLPLPSDSQEPLTLAYYTANIAPYLYNEGARVYHDADQAIPHLTWTALAFNQERYDTDTIHDIVTNNSRLTCKTAGKYIISFTGQLEAILDQKYLASRFLVNGTSIIFVSESVGVNIGVFTNPTTIYDLAVSDYVQVQLIHDQGAPRDCTVVANQSPEFMMQRIGA